MLTNALNIWLNQNRETKMHTRHLKKIKKKVLLLEMIKLLSMNTELNGIVSNQEHKCY